MCFNGLRLSQRVSQAYDKPGYLSGSWWPRIRDPQELRHLLPADLPLRSLDRIGTNRAAAKPEMTEISAQIGKPLLQVVTIHNRCQLDFCM